MHHNAMAAVDIIKSVKKFKAGNPSVLINSIWQNNYLLNEYIDFFNLIYVRKLTFPENIQELGIEAELVPDLSFYSIKHALILKV